MGVKGKPFFCLFFKKDLKEIVKRKERRRRRGKERKIEIVVIDGAKSLKKQIKIEWRAQIKEWIKRILSV